MQGGPSPIADDAYNAYPPRRISRTARFQIRKGKGPFVYYDTPSKKLCSHPLKCISYGIKGQDNKKVGQLSFLDLKRAAAAEGEKQAEAEVVPSSSLVEFKVEVGV